MYILDHLVEFTITNEHEKIALAVCALQYI